MNLPSTRELEMALRALQAFLADAPRPTTTTGVRLTLNLSGHWSVGTTDAPYSIDPETYFATAIFGPNYDCARVAADLRTRLEEDMQI